MERSRVSHILKIFEFYKKPPQFDLDDIQRKTICPVTFRQIGADQTHAKLSFANVLQMASGILAILSKHSIKTLIKCFVYCIALISVHYTPDLIVFCGLLDGWRQPVRENADILDKSLDRCDCGHFYGSGSVNSGEGTKLITE